MKRLIKLVPLPLLSAVESFLMNDFKRAKWFVTKSDPDVLEEISNRKMLAMFKYASSKVPAY